MKVYLMYLAPIAAMITSAVADNRMPYSLPMPYAPLPEYPVQAREKGWIGTGLFLIRAAPDTGLVISVTIVRTTGHSMLDKAAEKALYRWKVPGGIQTTVIPVTFTTKGVQVSSGTGSAASTRASK